MSFLDKISNRSERVVRTEPSQLDAALSLEQDEYQPRMGSSVFGGMLAQESSSKQRRVCGNAECTNSFAMPWRNRRRPIFEEQWGCSGRCVLAMVRTVLRREQVERKLGPTTQPHRHRVPLGLVMLAQGWITNPQLQKALSQQRASGSGRIGDWLVAECGLETDQVTRGLSVQWGCPVLTTDGFSSQEMALVMPRMFVEEFGMLPLRVAGSRLIYLGCEDRPDASVAFAVERMSGLKAESGLVEAKELYAARTRLYESDGVAVEVESAADEDALASRVTALLEAKQPLASRLVRLHHYYWLRIWLESGTKGQDGNVPADNEDMQDYLFTLGSRA